MRLSLIVVLFLPSAITSVFVHPSDMMVAFGSTRRMNSRRSVSPMTIAAATVGCCYVLSSLVLSATHRNNNFSTASRLIDILPSDLDVLKNRHVMSGFGVQLLLLGGFDQRKSKWLRSDEPPQTLRDRLDRITPTWKSGELDYSYPGGIFDEFDTGMSVAELASTLETIGLTPNDFDKSARIALSTMLTWKLPPTALESGPPPSEKEMTLLIFSFDATPSCWSVKDCPLPGPTNELLAATAAWFVSHRQKQKVHILAQWEVASALIQSHGMNGRQVTAIGIPGEFENTAQILEQMLCRLKTKDVVLLAHPDHLRRVLYTAQTVLRTTNCPLQLQPVQLYSAMQSYSLDWPREDDALFGNVTAVVHTDGQERVASWYDYNLGYFPDGDPQKWTHQRQVWILYDQWAMAKGIVTGVIEPT